MKRNKTKKKISKKEFEKIQQELYNNSSQVWKYAMLNDFGKIRL